MPIAMAILEAFFCESTEPSGARLREHDIVSAGQLPARKTRKFGGLVASYFEVTAALLHFAGDAAACLGLDEGFSISIPIAIFWESTEPSGARQREHDEVSAGQLPGAENTEVWRGRLRRILR